MKIYTKKGDQGSTGLIGGTRVSKGDVRIEAYGTIDELNSYIGLLTTLGLDLRYCAQLQEIQDRLFTIGSHLAADPEKAKMQLPDLLQSDIEKLEHWMDTMDAALAPLTAFILPGGHSASAHAHVARCICRRAERMAVTLDELEAVEAVVLAYLNRLSDYLFVLARKINHDNGASEHTWTPRH
ncbi:MAG: cob(I)yrinic acid a,c-diamide adenosyltransferase [Flavobacteriales bacterium]